MHKSIIRRLKKNQLYSSFQENIWGANITDMELINQSNKWIRFLFCVNDVFIKWVICLKYKKVLQLLMFFKKL